MDEVFLFQSLKIKLNCYMWRLMWRQRFMCYMDKGST